MRGEIQTVREDSSLPPYATPGRPPTAGLAEGIVWRTASPSEARLQPDEQPPVQRSAERVRLLSRAEHVAAR